MSAPAPERKLVARGLKKSFGNRGVVKGIGLEVTSGQVVGLLGPNGAGKTTTFYMVVGLCRPDSGQVLLDEEDLTAMPMHQRARRGISYLPQEPSVFRKLTVRQNLLAVLEMMDLSRGEREERTDTLMADLGISHIAQSFGYALSGGERRRVEIARALATGPAVRETLGVCDVAYIVNAGEVLEFGDPQQIAESKKAREIYLGDSFRL
ncbi:MAG: ATP-binding cassette domain-containing protein [Geobacter sp.]|nr:ATP-binding cassette domain-containing protein [Geobacter sp.]